ncbi:MAG: PAS domain S-box protein [Nitrosomonas sp.]|uniref:PAS domain S-box protein n=1 Tax=Nitrosomonas sp. TaxID=42353 RepID=UPI0032EC534A
MMHNAAARFLSCLHNRQFIFLPVFVVGICLLPVGFYVDHLHSRNQERDLRDAVFTRFSLLRATLEGNITSNAQLVQGLVASVSVEPDLPADKFAQLAQYLFKGRSQLRNIGAAPDLIIKYMYPLEGNEAAVGLNFRNHPKQLQAVLQARDNKSLLLDGPVDLVQGGQGFIARIPVFLDRQQSGEGNVFWGVISAVIDVEQLYQASGLLALAEEFDIALRRNGGPENGKVFFGTDQIFDQRPVLLDISLPDNGSWQMAAVPKGGWAAAGGNSIFFRLGLILSGILILLPLVAIARFHQKNRDSETRLRALFVMSPVGIALNDYATGRFIEFNDALLAPTGYSREEFLNLTYWDITPPEYAADEARQLESLRAMGSFGPYRKEYIRKDGSRYQVQLNGVVIRDASGRELIWSIIEDITARLQAEQALRESQERYQRLVEDIGGKFVIYSHKALTGELTYISSGVDKVFGITKEEAIGKFWDGIVNWYPDSLDHAYSVVTQIAQGKIDFVQFEMNFVHPDGSERTILASAHPASDANGDLCIEGIAEDITERKAAEEALIHARQEAERANQAKSQFLSSMSHELRTPLNAILGFSQLIELEDPDNQHVKYIREIRNAGTHLLALINEVLDLARIESGRIDLKLEPVEIGPIIEACISLVRTQADKLDVQLVQAGVAGKILHTDRVRFKQVILNLISNAVKYNRKGGTVHIDARASSDNPGYLRILITDTGTGIATHKMAELFQLFNRLDATNSGIEGTGIGLSISRQIVELMGGTVGADSELGVGSTFWIELPVE